MQYNSEFDGNENSEILIFGVAFSLKYGNMTVCGRMCVQQKHC